MRAGGQGLRPPSLALGHEAVWALGQGTAGDDVLARLARGQLSRRVMQLALLPRLARARAPEAAREARLDEAVARLDTLRDIDPGAVRATLLAPLFGAWSAAAFSAVGGHRRPTTDVLGRELGRAWLTVAAASLRAGHEVELRVPLEDDGTLALPGFGGVLRVPVSPGPWATLSLRAPGFVAIPDGAAATVVEQDGNGLAVSRGSGQWLPTAGLRADTADGPIEVELNDVDPMRRLQAPSAGWPRLDEDARARWQRTFAVAWSLLANGYPMEERHLRAHLRTLLPQNAPDARRSVSSTSADTFGAMALSEPPDAASFALTLIHEFQHTKLSALLDLQPLTTGLETPVYYAPWRDDPRPLTGLLQGTYAFLAVSDFWRNQRWRAATTSERTKAECEFARWHAQIQLALDQLEASGQLTPAGQVFVDGMRARLCGWCAEPVDPEAESWSAESSLEHRALWRVRNITPDRAALTRLLDGSLDLVETNEGAESRGAVLVPDGDTGSGRLRLLRQHIRSGGTRDAEALREVASASAADVAFCMGRYAEAAEAYVVRMRQRPGDPEAWVGLAATLQRLGRDDDARALLTAPELALAAQRRGAGGASLDAVVQLARSAERLVVEEGLP